MRMENVIPNPPKACEESKKDFSLRFEITDAVKRLLN